MHIQIALDGLSNLHTFAIYFCLRMMPNMKRQAENMENRGKKPFMGSKVALISESFVKTSSIPLRYGLLKKWAVTPDTLKMLVCVTAERRPINQEGWGRRSLPLL